MDHTSWELWPAAAHEEQGRRQQAREEEHEEQDMEGFVSIALTGGAELAEFKERWRLPLFSGDGFGSTQMVELRSKSGVSVEPFSFAASASATTAPPSGMGDDCAGVNSATRLLDGLSAAASPIVLKSRGVIQAERRRRIIQQSKSKKSSPSGQELLVEPRMTKQRAVSMDETSLNRLHELHYARKMDDLARKRTSSGLAAAALPLPLPPPPGNPARNHHHHHRRHLSIDLRASPAAKFVVQVMPWEISSSSSPSSSSFLDHREELDSTRRSIGGHCFVPFKWEEVPGKPKKAAAAASNGNGGAFLDPGGGGHGIARKLQLPPRLQHQDLDQEKQPSLQRSSPTSTLDRAAVEGSFSASSPRIDASSSSAASSCSSTFAGNGDPAAPRWIRALLALHIWETVRAISRPRSCEDEGDLALEICKTKKKALAAKNVPDCAVPYPSWSPAPLPRSSWFQRSPIRAKNSRNTNWAFGKIAWRSCNVVKRAVRFRWWSTSRSSRGFHSIQKNTRSSASIYKPLLCRVDGDSSAFGCSTTRI